MLPTHRLHELPNGSSHTTPNPACISLHRRLCQELEAALHLAFGRCDHHFLAARTPPEPDPRRVAGRTRRGPRGPNHCLPVLASLVATAAEGRVRESTRAPSQQGCGSLGASFLRTSPRPSGHSAPGSRKPTALPQDTLLKAFLSEHLGGLGRRGLQGHLSPHPG